MPNITPDFRSISSALFDGGWRSDDRDQLMTEYNFTEYELDQICDFLEEFGKGDKK